MAGVNYCDVCDLHLDDLSFKSHILGKKHERKVKMKKKFINKNGFEIIVNNIPQPYLRENIIHFFQQYGCIINFQFLNNSALILRYQEQKSALFLTQNKIYIRGRLLKIKKYTKDGLQSKQKGDTNKQNFIIPIIATNKSFDEQVNDLLQYLQKSMSMQQLKCNAVLSDLSLALNEWFPCNLHKFGSTVTGLGLQTSDIDIYVELLPKRPYNYQESMDFLKSTKRILNRNPHFKKVIGVFGAKTPIIKCEHARSGIHCDINFKNSLGIYNSELLKYLQTLDNRIKPLLLVIKCWAKQVDLTGSNKITNYALAMLVVYYLQQKKIIPSIKFLQSDDSTDDSGWNSAFDIEKGYLFKIENNQNLFELLCDFYKFYQQFNFKNVISPLTGTSYARSDFTKSGNIPTEYLAYKVKLNQNVGNVLKLESSIVVIDPFELSHNITPSTNNNILELFRQSCILSAKCFEKNKEYKESDVLLKLFSIKPNIKKEKVIRECEINLPTDELSFQMQAHAKEAQNSQHLCKVWLQRTQELVIRIMREILVLSVQDVTVSPDRKALRTENADQVHSPKLIQTVKYHCVGVTSVMRGRQKCKIIKANMTLFEHEKVISKYMMDKSANNKTEKPILDFYMTIMSTIAPTKISVKFTNNIAHHQEFILVTDYCKKKMKKLVRPINLSDCMNLQSNNVELKQKTNTVTEASVIESKTEKVECYNVPSTSNDNNIYKQLKHKKYEIRHDVIPPGFKFF